MFKYALPTLFIASYFHGIAVNKTNPIIHLIVFIILIYVYHLYDVSDLVTGDQQELSNKREHFIRKYLPLVADFHVESNYIRLYKSYTPKLQFLKQHTYLIEILMSLEFVAKFNIGSYLETILLLERFLELYYKIIYHKNTFYMINNYQTLKDVRNKLLKSLYQFIHSTPIVMKHNYIIDNTAEYIKERITQIKSFTDTKIRILNNKCTKCYSNLYDLRSKPPWPKNEYFDTSHDIY